MEFEALLERFAAAARAGDGKALAALFTEDGVYHDCFYGAFEGRAAIREMIEERFHGAAERFLWELDEPVRAGQVGYARYRFSFTSTLEGSEGRRVIFEGMSCFHFAGDLVSRYDEVFDTGIAMAQLGFAPERMARFLGRKARELHARADLARHARG